VLQDHVGRLEGELSETRQRADGILQDLDAARAKLRLLDDQLDGDGVRR
jgi:hypothetical protein